MDSDSHQTSFECLELLLGQAQAQVQLSLMGTVTIMNAVVRCLSASPQSKQGGTPPVLMQCALADPEAESARDWRARQVAGIVIGMMYL